MKQFSHISGKQNYQHKLFNLNIGGTTATQTDRPQIPLEILSNLNSNRTMNKYKDIIFEKRSKLAIITLNRPNKKNAISNNMYKEVTEALNEISENDNIAVTALTGAGDYYCSGTDLSLGSSYSSNIDSFITEASLRVRAFVNAFINHNKVLVAVVNGPAIGIAVTTLGLCDVVYCSDTATFQTPFTRLGLNAEGCSSYTFPRILGTAKASEMLLFNYKMLAPEALKVGLVAQVYGKEYIQSKLWQELEKYANELPVMSLTYSKALMRHFDKDKLLQANEMECDRLQERWTSDEFFNAISKFMSRSKM